MERGAARGIGVALGLLLSAAAVCGETPAEATAELQALARAFESAWNTHDMDVAFRKLLTDDVDWVNVDAGRGRGIRQVVEGHVRVHAGKFKDSVLTVNNVDAALVRPDVAVMHVSWGIRGDRDNDGTPRQPREGMFTWVAVRDSTGWKIRASHNTNRGVVK